MGSLSIKNVLSSIATLIYINIYCFLYGFFCLLRGEGSVFRICKEITHIFHPRFYILRDSKPIRTGRTMFFMNHSSPADYFVDCFMTGGSSYLSRLLIILLCPGPCFCGYLLNFVWFFYKKRGLDRKWFSHFVAVKWNHRPNSGCISYPEGKISKREDHRPLKTGVMEVAYNLNCPCQVVLTKGKDGIIDMKNCILHENAHLTICVSEVLIPHDYKTKEDWFAKVNEVWEKTYNILEKGEGETEIIAPLPGVNTDLCVDEKISLNAIVYSVCVMIAIVAVFYAICTM